METEGLFERMRDRVVSGEFAPGQRLRAEQLRSEYGVSATTMREILLRLSTLGLVDFQEQRGFRLPELSVQLRNELTQFRVILESEGASLSIRNGSVEWEARLSAAHHALGHIESRVHVGEPSPELLSLWVRAELDFHRTLIDGCGNEVLKQTHLAVYYRFRQQLITSDSGFYWVPKNIEQHKGIVDAALDKDEALVRRLIREHLLRNLTDPVENYTEKSA
ncbi:GntR family transcriptional regulator [Aliiruegeria lutimaris]|uniref:Transcriptional regulator, GntR family n=1 Tax=Aliiruegeria lutimaris TaxID=571298 RepID=A0A1G9II99_9RHOB|nr:GntR family transcriptional regulator [Aliiruegeria lutimaris]SDL24755.1 transcriptional regulator, GntR family [Aliiruegeria lutimaris]